MDEEEKTRECVGECYKKAIIEKINEIKDVDMLIYLCHFIDGKIKAGL